MELVAARLAQRADHFMPAALLASQFEALQEPQEEERPVIVSIEPPSAQIAARIVAELGCVSTGA